MHSAATREKPLQYFGSNGDLTALQSYLMLALKEGIDLMQVVDKPIELKGFIDLGSSDNGALGVRKIDLIFTQTSTEPSKEAGKITINLIKESESDASPSSLYDAVHLLRKLKDTDLNDIAHNVATQIEDYRKNPKDDESDKS